MRSSEKFEVRILRPPEFEELRDTMDPEARKICTALLLTGMRYAELKRLRENPDWLDGKFVYLPRGSMLKVKAKQRERAIRLSDMGKTLVPYLFQSLYPLPELPAFDVKLRRLSRRILEGAPVNTKTFGRLGNPGWCFIIRISLCRSHCHRGIPQQHSMSIISIYRLLMRTGRK